MKKKDLKENGITLVTLVVTIILLLILASITISALGGENGLIAKVNQAKKAQIKAEMKETLILAINELQLEKEGKATLDDITQDWANNELEDYKPQITTDASINGKRVTMKKSNVTGKYIIDENLNITEIENDSSIEFSYEVKGRTGDKVQILIHVQDEENGLSMIELPGEDPITVEGNKKREIGIDYEVKLGVEYKIKITSENGQTKEETIFITDYWYEIKKNLGEGISITKPEETKAKYNNPYHATIKADDEYIIDTITVTMGGQVVTVDKMTGIIDIEKVIGDIEITATARKLEIQVTNPIIGTENPPTSSVGDNSQTKGTKLYINFSATLEGQNCTITYKENEIKTLPFEVTKNGKYVFIIKGIYNDKTIQKEYEINVNKYKSAVGIVKYDAGEWTKEEIEELQSLSLYNINAERTTTDTALTFGGFTYKGDESNQNKIKSGKAITSRNESTAADYPSYPTVAPYDGWQILETHEEGEKTYVTKLVSARSSRNFFNYP